MISILESKRLFENGLFRYDFEELNGTSIKDYYNNYNGKLVANNNDISNIILGVDGYINKAVYLGSKGLAIEFMPSNEILHDGANLSVFLWCKIPVISSGNLDQSVFSIYKNTASRSLILGLDQTNKLFLFIDGDVIRSNITVSVWNLIGFTYDGTIFKLFHNKVLVNSLTKTISTTESKGVQLGTNLSSQYGMVGYVDNLIIRNYEMTQDEINLIPTKQIDTNNIISYYNFNDNVLDSVGNNDGTATEITYASGKSGNAAVFNGSTSNILIADSNNLSFVGTPFSISLFIKFTSLSPNILFLNKMKSLDEREYELRYSNNTIFFRLYDTDNYNYKTASFSLTPTVGQWYHIVATFDGISTIFLYLDGINTSLSISSLGVFQSLRNTTSPIRIGQYYGGLPFYGLIDGLSFWNKELVYSEVLEIYEKQNVGDELI